MQDTTFERWLDRAEHRAVSITGLDLDSLGAEGASLKCRDAYDAGESPSAWADSVIAESGFPVEDSGLDRYVPASRRRSNIKPGTGPLSGQGIRLAIDQSKVTGHLPILY